MKSQVKLNTSITIKLIIIIFVLAGLFTGVLNPFRQGPVTEFEQSEFDVMGFHYSTEVFTNSTRLQRLRMFTNQSNIFVLVITSYLLINIVRGKDTYNNLRLTLRGMGLISITATFFIYNFTLLPIVLFAGGKFNISDLFVHVSVPILFVADWVICDSKGHYDKNSPLLWLIYPLAYMTLIFILGAFDNFYPYFFLDVYQLPFYLVMIFVTLIILIFTAISYAFVYIDKNLSLRKPRNSA